MKRNNIIFNKHYIVSSKYKIVIGISFKKVIQKRKLVNKYFVLKNNFNIYNQPTFFKIDFTICNLNIQLFKSKI